MNLNVTNLTIAPCIVCDYLFSDRHHIWPQAKGGEKLPTVDLCPNHHRYANIVQAMLLQGRSRDEITRFAVQYFDRAFTDTILLFLIDEQERVRWQGWASYHLGRLRQAAQSNDQTMALAAATDLTVALIKDYIGEEQTMLALNEVPNASIVLEAEGYASIAALLRQLAPETSEAAA